MSDTADACVCAVCKLPIQHVIVWSSAGRKRTSPMHPKCAGLDWTNSGAAVSPAPDAGGGAICADRSPPPADFEALLEAAEAVLHTVGRLRGRGPEDADHDTHEAWAMDDLRKQVAAIRAKQGNT
jgi:hypothetical protein